jgi:hypothetical protein
MSTYNITVVSCSINAVKVIHHDTSDCSPQCQKLDSSPDKFCFTSLHHGSFEISKKLCNIQTPSSQSKKGPSPKPDTTAAPSEEVVLQHLRRMTHSVFSISESNVPWFESLFPATDLPKLQPDNTLLKADFNPLFKDIASKAKAHLKAQHGYSISALPRTAAAKVQEVIIASVLKSTSAKCPAKVKKAAAHLQLSKKESTAPSTSKPAPKPSKADKKPASSKPAPAPTNPSSDGFTTVSHKKTRKASSAKPVPDSTDKKKSEKTSQKQSTTSPTHVTHSISDVLKCLHEAHPPMYYAADKTPTFAQLFPKTSVPKHSSRSGNMIIDKEHFAPLLTTRIRMAYKALSASSIRVNKLPARFMAYQTRLICRSLEKQLAEKTEAKAAKKLAKAKKGKTVQFVPPTIPDTLVNPSSTAQPLVSDFDDVHEQVKHFRDIRSCLQAFQSECPVDANFRNHSLHTFILQNKALRSAFPKVYETLDRSSHIQSPDKVTKSNALVSLLTAQPRDPQSGQTSPSPLSNMISFVISRSSIVPLPSFD